MQDQLAIYVKDVEKKYGSTQVLTKLCLNVQRGTIYGLLGASGCGKTTILNCIVGKNKVDDGEIWILGEKCVGIAGSKVGYMPQDLALINEFTVKDSIYFFGRIFAMDTESLREKYEELTTLLNLPKDGRLVGDCSGGEKRRLSFAIALVHNPELLILDEPSVGVDPILRERIWNYLTETCSNNKTSILITTHYIEESRQANRIGFLREGKLLVESSPTSLLSKFNVPTLEEVFLICSRNQEEQIENANSHEIDHLDNIGTASPMEEFEMDCDSTKNHANESPKKIKNSSFSWHRFGALMEKNWKRIRRNKLIVGVQVMVPSIQILLFFFAIGRDVHNIPLGIVNDEATATYCENFPLNKTVVATGDWECEMDHISCRLLHHLDNPVIKKDYYGSIPEAMDDLKSGRIVGVMHMNRNLSSLVQKRVVEGIELGENGETLQNEVQVWMDMTNLNIGSSLKKKIYNLYEEFHASVYSECEFNPKTVEIPMRVEEYVYGTKDDEFIIFMVPGLIMMILHIYVK
ncbi:hypothetical protein JTB14_000704 [Gonioctena quinquepunctata]|nr:hypothetical protein JTB14_000704 [Gonioctena quinquepunctata]